MIELYGILSEALLLTYISVTTMMNRKVERVGEYMEGGDRLFFRGTAPVPGQFCTKCSRQLLNFPTKPERMVPEHGTV